MIYLSIGIAILVIVVIGSAAYLIYRKRLVKLPQRFESRTSEMAPESGVSNMTPGHEAAPETEKVAHPIAEYSTLPENAKLNLMNAVWYRCENPNCNYTQFLDVHHIVAEIEGGSNKLNNLIVLCPRCHAAAHNNEITEEELESWLLERAERFRTDLDWPYK